MQQNLRLQFIIQQIEDYGSQAAFARAINKPPQQITQWLKGEKAIGEKIVRDIESALGLPRGYIDNDRHSKDEDLEPGTFKIAEYNVKLATNSAHGAEVIDPNNIIRHHTLNESFLTEFKVKKENLAVVQVSGDSMEYTLRSGEKVVIDKSRKEVIDNRVFAITSRNQCWVKRVRSTPKGNVWQSDNEEYREFDKDLNDGATVRIEGLVLYSLGRPVL